jgi:hypothetical protein
MFMYLKTPVTIVNNYCQQEQFFYNESTLHFCVDNF